ncbi:PH-like domain-containing protein [Mycetocola reblochoni]|uniref:Integral membrane protein related to pyrimidine synthesis n=2 Tax=Mycetocola reblochoni TaxID=331618 RepID=A0A1R4J4Q5_9MICO|nr:hypothetical protein [Mycetocola reblochoni]RLP69513.1 hypothetical protein D9V30_06075 [Mycetocola reblochoni]SJN26755.1 Integral membrane protein related to pyrimidine synthesis [Mycetocola reblochoni REB411]
MLERLVPGLIVLAVLLLIVGLMYAGWRGRRRRGAPLAAALAPAPERLSDPTTSDALYVATTVRHDPLNRVTVPGLGFRARARLTVADEGVVIAANGEPAVFVPSADVIGAEQATWTIDRVVEDGGLTVIGWRLAGTELDSSFRLPSASAQHTIISRTRALAGTAPSPSESDTAS